MHNSNEHWEALSAAILIASSGVLDVQLTVDGTFLLNETALVLLTSYLHLTRPEALRLHGFLAANARYHAAQVTSPTENSPDQVRIAMYLSSLPAGTVVCRILLCLWLAIAYVSRHQLCWLLKCGDPSFGSR